MAMWNPWRGCHKHSEGCKYCYIHKGDWKRTYFIMEGKVYHLATKDLCSQARKANIDI